MGSRTISLTRPSHLGGQSTKPRGLTSEPGLSPSVWVAAVAAECWAPIGVPHTLPPHLGGVTKGLIWRYRSGSYTQGGAGASSGSSHPEGAPMGSGSHQARSSHPPCCRLRKIQALEEMVETLEKHQGKRPSAGWPAHPAPPLGLVDPGHQGSRASG